MWSRNKRQKTARIDTLIGQNTEVTGNVCFAGGLHVDGKVKGNVTAENDGHSMLSLSEKSTVEGEVNVPYVVINGEVIGDVHGNEHVELASKARVTGNVYYNLIEMAIGAEVNGKLVHAETEREMPLPVGHGEPLEAPE